MTNTPVKRAAYHHGNLKFALIESAMKILEESGVADITIRKVASRAKVSHMAPYNHFGNKQALLAAIATEGFRKLESALSSLQEDVSDPRENVRSLATIYINFAFENPALYHLMFGGDIEDRSRYLDLIEADDATAEVARKVCEACLSLSKRHPIATETVAVSAWALIHGLASLLIHKHVNLPSGRLPDQAFISEIANFFLSAMIPEDSLK